MDKLLEKMFANSFDGICIIDANGFGVMMNRAASKICSFPIDEFVGNNVKDALRDGSIDDSVSLKVLKYKKPVTKVVNIRGVDVLITGSPIKDEQNRMTHVVLNIRDIGELNNIKIESLLSIALKKKNSNSLPAENIHDVIPEMEGVIAKSPPIQEVLKVALKVARVDSTVLIHGESGVGKEVILKVIHSFSNRSSQPLIKVNCSAIPQHLLESELFGYERGAFTGADNRGKPGLFEQANGGTIFLDEIGDMPLDLQAKILRVLQEFEIMRVGGRKSIKINARVVSATNKNLDELVKEGKFRQDLFYRLNIVPLYIPPLRERPEDIAPLAFHFLHEKNKKYHLMKRFAPNTIHLLEEYDWPGNVREMENLIERLVVTTENDEICWSDLPFIRSSRQNIPQKSLKSILTEVEKKIIYEKLDELKTTRKTAAALGISQSTLVKKLQRFQEKADSSY
ncbi:sigma 54-interacting transcriptional regulator [Mesobacillus subterraneus]|uniref:sigma-54 interaction domain-containing protein n=1 Tax=Mesobacillus subterraneus TaxID=285983 RepID=UPI001CFC8420|nr:sigma 54-interacting transcriptional regulator [Mesobacillus subterraneus]WLR57337.1 sigma 54-interacting transcriptional regulator [Mesobacillus subterraneus]